MTNQIVQNVLAEAEKRKAKKVTEVHVVIGKLTFLGLDEVRFTYEALTKGTIMEGSNLIIEEQEGVVKCNHCGFEGSFQYEDNPMYHEPMPKLKCPKCGNIVNIVAGNDCTVKSVKMMV